MQMAALVLRGEPLYELAGAHLAALAEATNETANLGIAVDADRALYLRQVAGDHRVQTASWTGRTIPRHGTAMGAALAGELEPHGYAVSRGTLEPDITAIAVPVRDYHDKIVAALSIIAPSYRTGEYDVDRYGLLLVEHAVALSSALGSTGNAELRFPDPLLTDGVVLLRQWRADDLDFVVQACQDPEVSRYSPAIQFPYVEADAVGWFESQEPARLAGDAIDLAVTDALTGRPVGAIGLHQVNRRLLTAETGYWLAHGARGNGYMSRAVRLLAGWVFNELRFARLELRTDPENVASQGVAERCGFHREGHLRSSMLVLHSGQRRDSFVYGLLPGELAS